ncbi:phage tail tube protein [Sphingomonas sp. Ag1]|jgi:hypothetical protein|uniref:phage tail tube protein n=1 Tax=Sphingomonas sp. Ag1 TaxID=1642949 RepID=UPI0006222510|nr:phage tail tube protein [Sphingomonas sp. Ag1]KKI22332.1 hypothetical protein XM50_00780 [Sphingomonas sp. Ag1]
MAINPSDTEFAIAVGTADTVAPTAPAFKRLETIVGSNLNATADPIVSQTRRKGRTNAGQRLVNPRVEGTLNTEFVAGDAATELLLESAFSGRFDAEGLLKAGTTETNLFVERKWQDGAVSMFTRYAGCVVSEFALNAEFGGIVTADFTVLGLGRLDPSNAALAGAAYADASTASKLAGPDVKNIVIEGLGEVDYSTLSLTISQARETQGKLGSAFARGIGTSGKTVELAASLYRKDFGPENLIKNGIENPAVRIEFDMTIDGEGYKVIIPAAQPSFPEDAEEGANQMVNVTFSPIGDAVSGTDIMIQKITA